MGPGPASKGVVVACLKGLRGATAAEALTKAGYKAVNLEGGLISWKAAGLPLGPLAKKK